MYLISGLLLIALSVFLGRGFRKQKIIYDGGGAVITFVIGAFLVLKFWLGEERWW
jgi:hypothetical protein